MTTIHDPKDCARPQGREGAVVNPTNKRRYSKKVMVHGAVRFRAPFLNFKTIKIMTISEIKRRTQETSPYFFSKDTMRFFGQTMRSFSVRKQNDGRYKISAPMRNSSGETMGETVRYFNPVNNQLENN